VPLEPPLLVAAIMDRETNGRNILGDGGHGHGLMQLDDRSFRSIDNAVFSDGQPVAMDPMINIYVAARLLANNIHVASRARPDGSALWIAIAGYNADLHKVLQASDMLLGDELLKKLDSMTTEGNYVSDVLGRLTKFTAMVGST
jgi:hypothetical protein